MPKPSEEQVVEAARVASAHKPIRETLTDLDALGQTEGT